jgi:hypothetical protein
VRVEREKVLYFHRIRKVKKTIHTRFAVIGKNEKDERKMTIAAALKDSVTIFLSLNIFISLSVYAMMVFKITY